MTKQEINFTLGKELFGYSYDQREDGFFDTEDGTENGKNYIENWQVVVEKLKSLENFTEFWITHKNSCILSFYNGANNEQFIELSDTIGEAVCRAAVEYLKAVGK